MLKIIATAGICAALLASTSAFADTAAKPVSPRTALKIQHMSRAHANLDSRKTHDLDRSGIPLAILAAGAVVVGGLGAGGVL